MTTARKSGPTIGCLMIEDITSGGRRLSGLCEFLKGQGMRARRFEWNGGEDVHGQLQAAYHALRKGCDAACVLAVGSGVYAAMALSEQLDVERLMLLYTGESEGTGGKAPAGFDKLRRFARRNAAFCVADTLIAAQETAIRQRGLRRLMRGLANCESKRLLVCGIGNKKICTIDEWLPEQAVYRFLRRGELPKSLAENSEMCIIYE